MIIRPVHFIMGSYKDPERNQYWVDGQTVGGPDICPDCSAATETEYQILKGRQ